MKIEYTETMSPRRFGARGIALLYAGLGFTWILLTDVTLALLGDQGLESAAPQTAKGLLFVSLSAVVVYGLVSRSTRELQSARAALERANSERAIYDRILRHNFRNGLQVVGGNAGLALGAEGDERTEYIRNVEEGCDRLLDLCRDAREFSALIDSDPEPRPVDLAERLREAAAVVDDYPEATLDLDVPPSVPAMAVDSIDVAFRHALENACQHAGDDPPRRGDRRGARRPGGGPRRRQRRGRPGERAGGAGRRHGGPVAAHLQPRAPGHPVARRPLRRRPRLRGRRVDPATLIPADRNP